MSARFVALLHALTVAACAPPITTLGVEFAGWPLATRDVVPFAYGGQWTALDGSPAPTDGDGWPLCDSYTVFFDYVSSPFDQAAFVPASIWGNYTISFAGKGDIVLNPSDIPGLRISDVSFDAAAWVTSATLILSQPNAIPGFALGVQHSQRRSSSPTNTGFTSLSIIQPGSGDGSGLFTPGVLSALVPFAHVRVHEWSGTNTVPRPYPARVEWSDRRLLTDALWASGAGGRPLAVGAPWEATLALSHEAGDKSLWINVPVYASDEYVEALAALFAHGNASVGIRGISAPALYIEHGNELWLNTSSAGSECYSWNAAAASAEVASGGSPLNSGGCVDPEAWARRRHAKRLYEIADTFRAHFSGLPTAIRPVFAWMQEYVDDARGALVWLEETYGAGAARSFYALGINAYRGPGVFPAGTPGLPPFSTPEDVLSSLLNTSEASVDARAASAALANEFGLKLVAYAGGGWAQPAGLGTAGYNATLSAIIAFHRSEGAAEQQAYDRLINWPGEEYNLYDLSSNYGESYAFCPGLCEDVNHCDAWPKFAGALRMIRGDAQ